jgi:hypothetical protein
MAAAAGLAAISASANAAVISVQFLTFQPQTITAGPAGKVPEAPADWNGISDAGNSGSDSIKDDSAVPNSYNMTWASGGGWVTQSYGTANSSDANSQLMNNAIAPGGPNNGNVTSTFTVNGLPSGTYNVFVYVAGLDQTGDQQSVTLGSTTYYEKYTMASEWSPSNPSTFDGFSKVSSTDPTSYQEGNYVEFTNVTGSSITVNSIDTGGQTGFSGFQIQAVPEPTSLGLAGIGTIGLLARRRRLSR